MKTIFFLFFSLFYFGQHVMAQQHNLSELGHLDLQNLHSSELNDIWGYTDEFDNEYAIVGLQDGVSLVDVSNPTNPTEIYWVDGMNSVWRDIKTYNDYAYVTTEANEGLLIIDLSDLPSTSGLSYSHFIDVAPFNWLSAHNLYIDESGYLYVFGSNKANGGVIIYDLNTNPLNPTRVGEVADWYVHDGYVQNDTGYFSNVYQGFFSIFELSDKSNPVLLGTALTPSTFTHNIWGDQSGHVYVTDEISNGFISAFDVTNPSTPFLLDVAQSSPGDNIIPHNVHVNGNYIYTSYYADGVVVHDITHPNNLIEVGRFDTWPGTSSGFVGCWGVYPFFNSGIIVASDIEHGLFVLQNNVHQGSYIEGVVSDLNSGSPLSNVSISINGTTIQDQSTPFGAYATGIDSTGTVEVTYSRVFYYPKTLTVNVQSGVVTQQDVALEEIPHSDLLVKVYDAETNQPIPNAQISFNHEIETLGETNAVGEDVLQIYYPGQHHITIGKWGYISACISDTLIDENTTEFVVYLEKGYYDDFAFDFGWDTVHTGQKDGWIRAIPLGVEDGNGLIQNPFEDFGLDCNNKCFVTGNSSNASNASEVNGGEAILLSPLMDLTTYTNPHVNYAVWYFDHYGNTPDDTLFVYMNNGTNQVLIDFFAPEDTPMSTWLTSSVSLNDKIAVTNTMQLIIYISDYTTHENIVEAAFDRFSVTEGSTLNNEIDEQLDLSIYPNPVTDILYIDGQEENYQIEIYELDGRLVLSDSNVSKINLSPLSIGVYFLVVKNKQGEIIESKKLIKQ
ncbi:MAG: choice-of-anchor B family protein [Putridiphycobacter sp.]